jgi:adenylylsulfate kinase
MSAGAVVWITGLPASGKSTLARHVASRLRDAGREPLVLDGDEVRAALVPAHGYDDAGRADFYLSLGRLSCLAAGQGLLVIVAATAHRRIWRDEARARAPVFVEVYVATVIDECRRRDTKGLYARPDSPEGLPGVGTAYEVPLEPEVVAPHGDDAGAVDAIFELLGVPVPS